MIVLGSVGNIYADEIIIEDDIVQFVDLTDEEVCELQKMSICTECGGSAPWMCMNSRLPSTADDGYHNSTCYVTHYKSYVRWQCMSCGASDWYRVSGALARHYCLEVHSKCWKGNYDVCPV